MAEHDHKHGSMDTSVQEKTFEGFVRYVVWGTALSFTILILLYVVNG